MPSSADLAAPVEALLLRGLRPAGNVTRDGRPGSKSALYRVENHAPVWLRGGRLRSFRVVEVRRARRHDLPARHPRPRPGHRLGPRRPSPQSTSKREPLSTQPHWADELQFVCPRCRKAIELFSESPLSGCSVCHAKVQRIGDIYSFISECTSTGWQEFFDRRSQLPDGQTSAGNDYRFPIQQHLVIRGFQLLCGDEPNDARILDLGCGNGSFSRALWPDRFLAGVDYSIGMCRLAQSSALRVFHADALALPFANEQFDLIYSAEILQYVEDLSKLGEELVRVCRPGGRIIVSTLDLLIAKAISTQCEESLTSPVRPFECGRDNANCWRNCRYGARASTGRWPHMLGPFPRCLAVLRSDNRVPVRICRK